MEENEESQVSSKRGHFFSLWNIGIFNETIKNGKKFVTIVSKIEQRESNRLCHNVIGKVNDE